MLLQQCVINQFGAHSDVAEPPTLRLDIAQFASGIIFGGPLSPFERESDFSVINVDTEDFDFKILSGFDDVLWAFHFVVGESGDV